MIFQQQILQRKIQVAGVMSRKQKKLLIKHQIQVASGLIKIAGLVQNCIFTLLSIISVAAIIL